MSDSPILITGVAGFIGFHLAYKLIEKGKTIIGLDNFNNYYDPKLKKARVNLLNDISFKNKVFFKLIEASLEDKISIDNIFKGFDKENNSIPKPEIVVNLAAQAGVRHSIINPESYIQSNLVGFNNILEGCRRNKINHLVFASSSSVYGGNSKLPFSEKDNVDHPVSLYAATKKSNELIAHSYSHLYGLPITGLRFFTVYGPWGRPDMALFSFTKSIFNDEPINVFNNGNMIRDFTYIDDICESLIRVIEKPATPDINFKMNLPNPSTSWAPFRIFNIGNSTPINLMDYIVELENIIGIRSKKVFHPIQPGDVKATLSDCSSLEAWIDFRPSTPINVGIKKFVDWYKAFYQI